MDSQGWVDKQRAMGTLIGYNINPCLGRREKIGGAQTNLDFCPFGMFLPLAPPADYFFAVLQKLALPPLNFFSCWGVWRPPKPPALSRGASFPRALVFIFSEYKPRRTYYLEVRIILSFVT